MNDLQALILARNAKLAGHNWQLCLLALAHSRLTGRTFEDCLIEDCIHPQALVWRFSFNTTR